MTRPCPICSMGAVFRTVERRVGRWACPGCGEFTVSPEGERELEAAHKSGRQLANIRGWLCGNRTVRIEERLVAQLLELRAPPVAERADRVLQEIEATTLGPGKPAVVDMDEMKWRGIAWAEDEEEVQFYVHRYLFDERGFLRPVGENASRKQLFAITPPGYAHLDKLREGNPESRIGFCAMWFDRQMDSVWTDAIAPAIEDAGYEAKRMDAHQHNEHIDDEMLRLIRRSKFLVADCTGQRHNVYFEAGFGLALGLPVIFTCEESHWRDMQPFDTRQYSMIAWDRANLPELKRALTARIEATIGRGPIRSQ